MAIQKVETFEHDIASEILKKEASVAKVAATDALVADVTAETSKKTSSTSPLTITILIAIVVVLTIGVIGYFAYNHFVAHKSASAPITSTSSARSTSDEIKAKAFGIDFPELEPDIGTYVERVDKTAFGFSIPITNYEAVFSYVIKNEDLFAGSVAKALGVDSLASGPYLFSDVTISNENIRVGVSGSSTVAYAFVNGGQGTVLVVATSTDGITASSAILGQ